MTKLQLAIVLGFTLCGSSVLAQDAPNGFVDRQVPEGGIGFADGATPGPQMPNPGITKRSPNLEANLKELSNAHYLLLKSGIAVSINELLAQIASDPTKASTLERVLDGKIESPVELETARLVTAAVKQTVTLIFHECAEATTPQCAKNARAELVDTLRKISKMKPDELKKWVAGAAGDLRLISFLSGALAERIAFLNIERDVFLKTAVGVMTARLQALNAQKPKGLPSISEAYLASGRTGTVRLSTVAQVTMTTLNGGGTFTESVTKRIHVATPPSAEDEADSDDGQAPTANAPY